MIATTGLTLLLGYIIVIFFAVVFSLVAIFMKNFQMPYAKWYLNFVVVSSLVLLLSVKYLNLDFLYYKLWLFVNILIPILIIGGYFFVQKNEVKH